MGAKKQGPGEENCPGAATANAASSGAYSGEYTCMRRHTPTTVSGLISVLSTDRFMTYESACRGDRDIAIRLYSWNIAIASAFWGGFSVLEVALRNTLHNELFNLAKREDWWKDNLQLHQSEFKHISKAYKTLKKIGNKEIQPGHIIAELSLGFWTGLLANRYHKRLWDPALNRAFPHLTETRKNFMRN